MLTEDPIQVMFNGSVDADARAGRRAAGVGVSPTEFSVAITEYDAPRLLARRRQRRRLLQRRDAGALGRATRDGRRPT